MTQQTVTAKQLEQTQLSLASDLENRQKYWRWFVLAACVLLLVETMVAAAFSKTRSIQSAP